MHHRIASAQRHALAHLIVGKHSAELGAPVYHCVAAIGYAEIHEHIVFLNFRESLPLFGSEFVVAVGCGIAAFSAIFFKMLHKFLYGLSFIELGVIVALEHFQERPLSPLVI